MSDVVRQVATIVHLTDLHLYVDEAGRPRNPNAIGGIVGLVKRAGITAIDKIHVHSSDALIDLRDALEEIDRDHDPSNGPLLVAHTGDVEVVGPMWADGAPSWLGLEYVRNMLENGARHAVWAHVYGNHDVWPGGLPLPIADSALHRQMLRAIEGTATYAQPFPSAPLELAAPHGYRLRVHRANSVPRSVTEQALAHGRLGLHPHEESVDDVTDACLDKLAVHSRPCGDDSRSIDVVLMHHPPHAFQAGIIARNLGAATFHRSDEFGARLASDVHLQLVLAGHRHHLDPGDGSTDPEQRPLPPHCLQLVAESPTASSGPPNTELQPAERASAVMTRSFSVYRISADNDAVTISRTLWQRLDHTREGFRPGTERYVSRVRS